MRVGDSDIHPVPLVRNFGCWFDSRLSMASHITKLFASLFYHIYNIRWIRKCLSRQSTEILVLAFITYSIAFITYGLPGEILMTELRVELSLS